MTTERLKPIIDIKEEGQTEDWKERRSVITQVRSSP